MIYQSSLICFLSFFVLNTIGSAGLACDPTTPMALEVLDREDRRGGRLKNCLSVNGPLATVTGEDFSDLQDIPMEDHVHEKRKKAFFLPPELLKMILYHLPQKDLLSARLVHSSWFVLCQESPFSYSVTPDWFQNLKAFGNARIHLILNSKFSEFVLTTNQQDGWNKTQKRVTKLSILGPFNHDSISKILNSFSFSPFSSVKFLEIYNVTIEKNLRKFFLKSGIFKNLSHLKWNKGLIVTKDFCFLCNKYNLPELQWLDVSSNLIDEEVWNVLPSLAQQGRLKYINLQSNYCYREEFVDLYQEDLKKINVKF